MKAVIPAAGLGTRFLPATKSQPKEMLPVVDKPAIQYVVEEAVASGIDDILIVTGRGKRAIEDHFDRAFELEYFLDKKGDNCGLAEMREISGLADICYIRQKEPLGQGHAIMVTRSLVGNEPFAVFFADDIIESAVPCMKQMMDVYERYKCSVVAVQELPREEISRYGVIDGKQIDERVHRISGMVEKPAPEEAPSNLGIVGRYILTPEIFDALEHTPPGKGGEIWLADGLRNLLDRQAVYGYQFEGIRYDTGTKLGYLRATVEYALRRPDLGEEFRQYLRTLDLGAA
jgi:UTP--glucose-1-phosphate uridylyltransferase